MIGRLIYERFYRFDPNDHINMYVQTLPSEVLTPLVWSAEDVEYLKNIGDAEYTIEMPILE